MSQFSSKLKALRKQSGLTQAELANRLGVGKSTISMYELGAREPDFGNLEALADLFNVPMSVLLGDCISTIQQPQISDADIKAAFWGGDKDLSKEDIDELWRDVQDYAAFKAKQKKKEK